MVTRLLAALAAAGWLVAAFLWRAWGLSDISHPREPAVAPAPVDDPKHRPPAAGSRTHTVYIDGIGGFAQHSGPEGLGVASDATPAPVAAPDTSGPHIEGRHTDGSCAVCDWLDESVDGKRRRGVL